MLIGVQIDASLFQQLDSNDVDRRLLQLEEMRVSRQRPTITYHKTEDLRIAIHRVNELKFVTRVPHMGLRNINRLHIKTLSQKMVSCDSWRNIGLDTASLLFLCSGAHV